MSDETERGVRATLFSWSLISLGIPIINHISYQHFIYYYFTQVTAQSDFSDPNVYLDSGQMSIHDFFGQFRKLMCRLVFPYDLRKSVSRRMLRFRIDVQTFSSI